MSRRLALTALAGLALALTPARAGARPVNDYTDYPTTVEGVPDGCAAPALTGVSFWVGSGPPAADLATVVVPGIHTGDTVNMAWTGQTPECDGTVVSLAIKHATQPFFNPAEDQELAGHVSTTASGPGQLAFTLPDLTAYDEGPCNYQLDAIVGPPLAVVGPSGSFYGPLPFPPRNGGGRNMLISAANGAYDQCEAPPTTTTTTTVVDTSRPPSAGQEVAPPASPTPGPGEPSTGGGEPASETPSPAAPATAANLTALPATGPKVGFVAFVISGLSLLAAGVAALCLDGRKQRRFHQEHQL